MRYVVVFLSLIPLAVVLPAAEEPTPTAEPENEVTLENWLVGKSEQEVIDLLGTPKKRKKRKGKSVLLYEWVAPVTRPPTFPGQVGSRVAPVPVAASPQPSDLGDATVEGSKAPPIPPNWRELRRLAESEAEDGSPRRTPDALEITFGPDDRVSSCRMVPRKNKKSAKKPKPE
jgi:hypothetical protein